MELGLLKSDLEYIIESVKKIPEIEKAIIFGSRAKGNHKAGSDIDLAIDGVNINFDTVARLHYILEETGPLPYLIDVVDYTHLTHKELSEHISRVGKTIFERNI